MGRIRTNIQINNQNVWTLFDSGARNTYITADKAANLTCVNFSKPEPVSLGGAIHHIKSECIFFGTVEGYHVHVKARIIDELGVDEEGKRIEILFGALAMQEWGIRLLLVEEKLDLSCYPKEFVEY